MESIKKLAGPIEELYSIIPDSIMFGSFILYFLTLNLSYAVFGVFILESSIIHRIIGWGFSQFSMEESRTSKCRAGYKTERLDVIRMQRNNYPSYGLFSLTSILTYLGASTAEFASTLKEMGNDWPVRVTLSYIFIIIIFILSLLYQSMKCEEGISEMVIAVVLAILTGVGFLGSDIYVCQKS